LFRSFLDLGQLAANFGKLNKKLIRQTIWQTKKVKDEMEKNTSKIPKVISVNFVYSAFWCASKINKFLPTWDHKQI